MIGQEIRRRRREKGLTIAQLAERSNMAPSAISQIETGKRTPSSESVIKLAHALEVEVGELYPKKAQAPLPLEERRASAKPRARSAAAGHLTIARTLEDLEEDLTPEQIREILEGVRDGRITVKAAASRLEKLREVAYGD